MGKRTSLEQNILGIVITKLPFSFITKEPSTLPSNHLLQYSLIPHVPKAKQADNIVCHELKYNFSYDIILIAEATTDVPFVTLKTVGRQSKCKDQMQITLCLISYIEESTLVVLDKSTRVQFKHHFHQKRKNKNLVITITFMSNSNLNNPFKGFQIISGLEQRTLN